MKRTAVGVLCSTIVALELLAACRSSSVSPDRWLIESYDKGVITVTHAGKRYRAACAGSRSFNNAPSVTDPKNVVPSQSCDLAISLVGNTVQGFGGTQRGPDGSVLVMWDVGKTLALRSWRDERTPWRMDEFTIRSVTAEK
ncbi:MAG: hypothetical protein M3167_02445 [Acidobacteriota bacterium]|nr:hypothetical protein [Acidobacteriota bacterium]